MPAQQGLKCLETVECRRSRVCSFRDRERSASSQELQTRDLCDPCVKKLCALRLLCDPANALIRESNPALFAARAAVECALARSLVSIPRRGVGVREIGKPLGSLFEPLRSLQTAR